MKKLPIYILLVALICACSSNSYSKLLKEEKNTIADYIDREDIQTTTDWPGYCVWPENLYYEVPGYDNFYFHLSKVGDSVYIDGNGVKQPLSPVKVSDRIVLRYKKYLLTADADTISYWTTQDSPYPTEFEYYTSSACTAWHEAVRLMRYTESECRIICPSKVGEEAAQSSVTPYGYRMYMLIRR